MSERLMKEMMVRLSLDMDDFRKEMSELQTHVQRSMDKVADEFADTTNKVEKLGDEFKEVKSDAKKAFEDMADSAKANSKEMVNAINKGFGKITSGAKGIARTLATAFSIREVAQFGKSVVEATAEIDALDAQFEQVMKGMEDEAGKAVDRMSKEFGMLPNRLRGNLSAFTSQFKGLGLEDLEALEEAENALTLSADAAAFFDMSIEEATEHVRSFIKGNYIGGESVQLFGSETMIATWASKNMGSELKALGGKWKNLDEASKQYFRMRYAEQMYKEAGVTGQANREMDMYANVIGNAKQAWIDFKASLGEKLLERTNGALGKLSDLLSDISESGKLDKIAEIFADIGGVVFDGAINGIKKIADWIGSVDWWLVGKQIETIWGYLKEFAEGVWDGLSTAIEPIADFITDIWNSINSDVNTENMDDVNTALVKVKPIFKWLSENGEAVGKGIIAICSALGTINTLKITGNVVAVLTGEYKAIKEAGSFLAWLVGKLGLSSILGDSVLPSAGSAVAGSGLKVGSMAMIEIAIPVLIGFVVNWAWKLGGDPEEEAKQHGIDSSRQNWLSGNKTRLQEKQSWAKTSFESKATKYDDEGNAHFDWDSTAFTKGLKEFVTGLEWGEFFKSIGDALAKAWGAFSSPFKKFIGWCLDISDDSSKSTQNRGQNTSIDVSKKVDWKATWKSLCTSCSNAYNSIANSAFGKFIGFCFGFKTADDAKGADTTWFDTTFANISTKWNNFIDGIMDSKFVTGLTEFLGGLGESWSTWGDDISENWENLKKDCAKFWEDVCNSKFGQGVKNFFNGIIDIYNAGVSGILGICNLLIDGVNGIYKGLTGKEKNLITRIDVEKSKVPHLAKGTDSWKGGTALVGEAGRELVSDPRLGTFMADRPMLLPLSQGAMVLRNSKTERLLSSLGIKAFAGGTNEGFWDKLIGKIEDIWSYATDPKALWNKLLEKIGLGAVSENPIIQGLASGVKDVLSGASIIDAFKAMFDSVMPDTTGIASVDGWIPMIHKAAAFFGEKLSSSDLARILQQIRNESGGNQTVRQSSAVQDINAKTGNWARGLLQYIPPTFRHYAVKGFGNINNGFHQLLAFFNNSQWRQNLPKLGERRGWSPRGARRKAKNGILVDGATPLTVGEAGQEAVVPLSNARALKPFGQSVMNAIKEEVDGGNGAIYEFTIPLYIDGREVAKATATFTKAELDKMEKRSNRLGGRK